MELRNNNLTGNPLGTAQQKYSLTQKDFQASSGSNIANLVLTEGIPLYPKQPLPERLK